MPRQIFKNRIQKYMEDHHMSDRYVLDRVNVSRNTFYRLKRGGFARLDATTANEFATLFGVPYERLFYLAVED